jgi:hypothetical protein
MWCMRLGLPVAAALRPVRALANMNTSAHCEFVSHLPLGFAETLLA